MTLAQVPAAVTGYAFTGWTTADATIQNGAFTMPAKGVTLTGTWTAQYSYELKLDINDGTNTEPQTMSVAWCDETEHAFTWTNPTRDGYTFLGWAETKDGTTDVTGENKNTYTIQGIPAQKAEKTLYAIWESQTGDLKLTFNGGETAPAIVTVSGQGLNITLVLTKAETIIRDLPTGEYTVTAESGSAQMAKPGVSDSSPEVKDGEITTVNITIESRGLNWFTAFYRVKNQCS